MPGGKRSALNRPLESRRAAGRIIAVLGLAALLATSAAGQETLRAIDAGGLETRSAALILSGQEGGALEVSVLPLLMPVTAWAPESGTPRVTLVVDIGGESLLAGAEGEQLVTEIYAYALGTGGEVAGVLTQVFVLDLERHRDALAGGGVKFLGHLDLPPGDYSLRVLAVHRRSDRLGLRVAPMTVPAAAGPAPVPLFPEPSGRWIVVQASNGTAAPFPASTAGRTWVPATRPRVDSLSSTEVYLLGSAAPGPQPAVPAGAGEGLRAHVLAADGEELVELGLGDLRPVAGGPAGTEVLAAELSPFGLPPGEYRLRISAVGGGLAAVVSTPLVVEPAAATADLEPASAPEETVVATGSGLQKAQAAYLQALGHLAFRNRPAARRALAQLEESEIHDYRDMKRLTGAQLAAASAIVGTRSEGLLPLIWLHEQLYRQYHKNEQYLLATHSREILLRLAEAYLDRSASPEAHHLVASSLVSLGGYLQEIGARPVAADLYRRALNHDPEHEAALLGLASVHEWYGDHEEVAELLERFVGSNPRHREARLRLGITRRRLGSTARAAELLGRCIAGPEADWITVVAYQELAALHAAGERDDEAIAVLEEAVERFPGVQRLHIQLAALLDRLDRPVDARAVLARLDPGAGLDADSPRQRYRQMPTAALARTRQNLAEEVFRRLPPVAGAAARKAAEDPAGRR